MEKASLSKNVVTDAFSRVKQELVLMTTRRDVFKHFRSCKSPMAITSSTSHHFEKAPLDIVGPLPFY